jgi:hypothetical protein
MRAIKQALDPQITLTRNLIAAALGPVEPGSCRLAASRLRLILIIHRSPSLFVLRLSLISVQMGLTRLAERRRF